MANSEDTLTLLGKIIGGAGVEVSAAQWPEIVGLASRHGLTPMLLRHICRGDVDSFSINVGHLKRTAQAIAAHYTVLELAHAAVEEALRHEGLSPVWIKGITLANSVYPDPILRPMCDLDFLVPPNQRHTALAAVERSGYQPQDSSGKVLSSKHSVFLRRTSHHVELLGTRDSSVTIELHDRLLGISKEFLAAEELPWFLRQTTQCHTALTRFLTLAPTAHFLYLCAHAELQHAGMYLLRYLDLHFLISRTPPDWSVVIDRAVQLRWTLVVERALLTCAKYFDTKIPPDIITRLRQLRPPSEDVTWVVAKKLKGARWVNARRRLKALSIRDRLGLALLMVLPSVDYVRSRYKVPDGQRVWPYYLYRWVDQAGEVIDASRHRFRSVVLARLGRAERRVK